MSDSYHRLLLFSIAAILISLIGMLPPERSHQNNTDEFYYLQYAHHVAAHGTQGVRNLLHWYAQSEEHRYHPAPIRMGYLFLASTAVKWLGVSFSTLTCISYCAFVLFCIACYYYSKKIFSRDVALCLTFLLCASPLISGMSRLVLTESVLNLFWGLTVWAFLDYLNQRSLGKIVCLVLFRTLSLLVKESSVLLLFFIVIVMLVFARYFKLVVPIKDLAIIFLMPAILAFMVYWAVLGGWQNILLMLHTMYLTHFVDQGNLYATMLSSGPWFRYFVDFILLSPVISLIGIGYAGFLICDSQRDWKQRYFLVYFITIMAPLSLLSHTKVVRFVINLEMVLVLFSVFALVRFFRGDIRQGLWMRALLCLLFLFTVSFQSFYKMFVLNNMLDPITYHMMVIHGFIPPLF
ncbi:MAG: glycosyltransferase family 39 protein [Candidatus Omnitrophica bacterium]|nr:glycosyltransferase family 39 protein [Candidatus Omnitrophota bacterium]